MPLDLDRLESLIGMDADPSNQHRVRTVLGYLDLRDDNRVLDCGCGLGWFLKVIGELYACPLHGIDRDGARLAHAARELAGRARLATASTYRLPFAAATFDKIVLAEVLEHVEDDEAALQEVHRVLRPGGVLAVTVPNARYPFWWDPINRSRERLGLAPIRHGFFGGIWTSHVRLYRRDQILGLLERNGFVVTDSRNLVRRCLPFSHNLIYGFGKWAVESGLLTGADRFNAWRQRPSLPSPARWALGLTRLMDRGNADLPDDVEPSVSIAVRAVRRK